MSNADIKGDFEFLNNAADFNIMQYIEGGEFDTPEDDNSLVSPTSSSDNGSTIHSAHTMLQQQQQRRLPDSPPMTDICGNVSSASSSSHRSDQMFSPNGFNAFNGSNNNGMILGVHQIHMQQQQQQWNQQPQQSQLPAHIHNIIQEYGRFEEENSRKRARPCETPRLIQALNSGCGQSQYEFNGSGASATGGDENYNHQQAIKFTKFQEELWCPLYDANGVELQQFVVNVVADKGFNYSSSDNCFINQKKNHFQVSVHLEASDSLPPKFVGFEGSYEPVTEFSLVFVGVKAESPNSEIAIKQSKNDRKPYPHEPVKFEVQERRMTKVTVPRLHFSETTLCNQRKNNRPNAEQKYFLLVARLYAGIGNKRVLIQSYASDKVIVRATNPGSFEPPDSDVAWIKNGNTLATHGAVSIGTDKSNAKLTVDGDIYTTGKIVHPSDRRLKDNIESLDGGEAMDNIQKLRIVKYQYKKEIAEQWGMDDESRKRTGLIAQELAEVLPDAVKDIGDYLTIDESRVFYETVLATQELCRLTGDLDSKIDEKVAQISKRLSEYARKKKLASSMASNLNQDNKSFSLSRGSLISCATTTATIEPKKTHRRRQTKKEEEPACKLRMSQGTMMTLVSVMALCLLAMSALYVLDWHNRNFGYHHGTTTEKPISKGEPANLIISPAQYMPTYQPDAPPLLAHCLSTSCQSYCCGDKPEVVEIERNINIDEEVINKTSGVARAPLHNAFNTGVNIRIPLLNITLDNRYCVERSCNERRGIFNLYVPVSRFMPDEPIEIEIDVPDYKIINNCGHLPEFEHKICPLSQYSQQEWPTSTQIVDNTFELSIGSFVQSAYRFRIGYTTESCFSEEPSSGSYDEYNLIFYRMCTPTINQTTTSSPINSS